MSQQQTKRIDYLMKKSSTVLKLIKAQERLSIPFQSSPKLLDNIYSLKHHKKVVSKPVSRRSPVKSRLPIPHRTRREVLCRLQPKRIVEPQLRISQELDLRYSPICKVNDKRMDETLLQITKVIRKFYPHK